MKSHFMKFYFFHFFHDEGALSIQHYRQTQVVFDHLQKLDSNSQRRS